MLSARRHPGTLPRLDPRHLSMLDRPNTTRPLPGTATSPDLPSPTEPTCSRPEMNARQAEPSDASLPAVDQGSDSGDGEVGDCPVAYGEALFEVGDAAG